MFESPPTRWDGLSMKSKPGSAADSQNGSLPRPLLSAAFGHPNKIAVMERVGSETSDLHSDRSTSANPPKTASMDAVDLNEAVEPRCSAPKAARPRRQAAN